MKEFDTEIVVFLFLVLICLGLFGCVKQESYPNKMNTIAEKLSQFKL